MPREDSISLQDPSLERSPLGIIAGNGEFPLLLAQRIQESGRKVVAALHRGEADERLTQVVDQFEWVNVGQLGKIIRLFQSFGVKEVVFLGGIRRKRLFATFRPDLIGLKVLLCAPSRKDDGLLRYIAGEFLRFGFVVTDPARYLPELLVRKDFHTTRPLTEKERADALVGWDAAEELGMRDEGQTVIVSGGRVVAQEGPDGTDATLVRAGEALKGSESSAVVVKLPKLQQDRRLDLPAVGPKTIRMMVAAKCSALVLQENGALLLEPEEVLRMAKNADIAIRVVQSRYDLGENHES